MVNYDDFEGSYIPDELLKNVSDNIENNKIMIQYYERFLKHDGKVMFSARDIEKKIEAISNCNRLWMMDYYEQNSIMDFVKTNLCKDKFCSNCKNVKQASRMARYIPELEKYRENLYHVVFTIPNCSGLDLKHNIDNMSKAFRKLIRFLEGSKKIKGIDFSGLGYQGAVKSLETTFQGKAYHPHLHTAFIFTGQFTEAKHINQFSYDNRGGVKELKRLFTDEEVLIQKIWYLLINGQKVTKKAIEEQKEGYSCIINKFSESDYAEVFKYMTKATDQKGRVLTYTNFLDLLYNLYCVRQIQGYGVLYRITDEGDTESMDEQYKSLVNKLREIENPRLVYKTPVDLLKDTKTKKISRKTYFKYLRECSQNNNTTPDE